VRAIDAGVPAFRADPPARAIARERGSSSLWSRAISCALTVGRAAVVVLPVLLAVNIGDVAAKGPRDPARVESSIQLKTRFDREGTARFLVARSRGAIKEAPSPFPGSTLFEPTGESKGAAILILHGSEGGSAPYAMDQAADLAAHGYAVLAFAYFDVPGSGLPKELLEVSLDRTLAAADWLKRRYGRVHLVGASRGGEQALELASLDPEMRRFDAVAGEVPSSQIWGAWDHTKLRAILDRHGRIRPAWTLGGRPLEEGEPIAIERYPGPIYLQGSGRDDVWPSVEFVRQLERRLERAGKHAEVHIMPRERHVLSEAGHRQASQWLLDFLDRALSKPPRAR
jgi:dienelactone hydrolase